MPTTREITIQRVLFEIMAPYAEGHSCTEAEAHALNQTRAENIRNNMTMKVKAAWTDSGNGEQIPPETLAELAQTVAAYDADYVFNMASAGGGAAPKDPVAAEAMRTAKKAIAGLIRTELSLTLKAYLKIEGNKEKYDDNVAVLANTEAYHKAAKKTVADRARLAAAGIEELSL